MRPETGVRGAILADDEEVKVIELESLLDLLENTFPDSRPEWTLAADDLVKTVENLLRENGRLK